MSADCTLNNWRVDIYISLPKYGLFYNWYAVDDIRNVASIGWHVPTNIEWGVLSTYLGGSDIAGGKLKESGYVYWQTPNTDATNSSGFNGKASGYRLTTGDFASNLQYTYFWATTEQNIDSAYVAELYYLFAIFQTIGGAYKKTGSAIRLVKDSTSLINGQTGMYTGNDGKVYRTICIGTQEWLADNLAETKYRNGNDIPEVTDGTAWSALTTGALCALNNDWNNVFI